MLDTSGLLAYLFEDEPLHTAATELFETEQCKVTHNYILAELVALAQARKYPREPVLGFLTDILRHPLVETVWIDHVVHEEAATLLRHRLDKSYSLCEAASFVIMRGRGISTALTTDRHFAQEGFVRLLEPKD